jgi:hypothetical protein
MSLESPLQIQTSNPMKPPRLLALLLTCTSLSPAVRGGEYTNFIRQVQLPTGVQWDATVAASGEQNSALPLDVGGARFELWTVLSEPLTSYLLDTRYVNAYAPAAEVVIRSEDPYPVVPRTRADRPFFVDVTVSGLLAGATDPEASKAVKLLRHVQSYGVGGTGENIDRTQASLLSQVLASQNGTQTLTYTMTSVPSDDLTKVTGEERFSVYSLADGETPESQIASRHIQIWPMADATISGISDGQKIRFKLPQLTLTFNDLYPESQTYAQVYRGKPQEGGDGTVIPGASLVVSDTVPKSKVLVLNDYDGVFDGDGTWTMEILTKTPFGTDRLAYVSFEIDRTISVNGMVTSYE